MELATRSEMRWSLVRTMAIVSTLVVLFSIFSTKFGANGRTVWFASLVKPESTPSPEAFTLWWGLVFLFLGLAIAIIWQARGATFRRPALLALALVFVLGWLWSPVTFGMRHLLGGAAIGGLLTLAALAGSGLSFRVRKSAGTLMIGVTLWAAFCAYSGSQLWRLNHERTPGSASAAENLAGENTPF